MRLPQNKYIHSLNYICHRRAAAAAEKKSFYIARAAAQTQYKMRCNMASSPFYTHQLLFLYYIMPHHAYLYVQISFIYAAAHKLGIPGARMLLLVSPVWWSERCMRAGMRPAAATGICIVTAGVR